MIFTMKCNVVAAIFQDSVRGVIPVPVDKINQSRTNGPIDAHLTIDLV